VKSVAVFPVLIRDTLVGTIALHQCDAFRVWVAEDIALLRALAEHLGVALNQAQLFQTLARQKGTLEKTLQELQQAQLFLIQSEKMAVLGQFVAGIAHEVNTPLGTLMSNQDTLKSCLDKSRTLTTPLLALQKEDPDFQRQLQKLDTTMDSLLSLNTLAATRIAEIVKNLRNFARLDESELKVVDLHEGLESTLLLVKSSLHPKIGIIRCYQPRLPMVQCYPGLLNQVFMNLIVNASHAIQEAMETLNRTAGTITIETATVAGGSWIEICVTDTGKGIHPDNLGKVFDPGFTTKGVGVGTGLGLALCYQMVNKHHGTITVSSQHNEGACFTVRIPNRVGTM
jgi:signal transduction histidine kinase